MVKLEAMKGMSREEREEYFKNNKSQFIETILTAVNGGAAKSAGRENPDSEQCPYKNCWFSSFGFICDGEQIC